MSADPRIASATATGPEEFTGDELVICEPVTSNGELVLLPKALPGVPEYVAAAHAEVEANALQPRLAEGLDRSADIPYQPNAGLVFDFRAAAASVTISAVAGLEAYANHHVERFCPPGATATYNGRAYPLPELRNLSLDQRLGEVLPQFMAVPKPTQEAWWPTFKRVQALSALNRHAVMEPMARSGLTGEKSLAQRLCDREYVGAASMMLGVFEYFSPGWLPPQRLADLPEPPSP